MKINILRETLLKPLQMVIGVVEKKQAMPILSNVLLAIKDNKLSITGTDSEVELIGQTDPELIDQELSGLTLPGRKLMDICRALPESAPIELYKDKERVVLRSGRSRFTLSSLPANEFPNTESDSHQNSFIMTQHDLKHLLQRTYFAMAQQDVRYYLNGMLLELNNDTIRAIATDGHRMALNTANIQTNTNNKRQVIIPRKGVIELLRLLENEDQPITIALGANHLCVEGKNFKFTSKLVEGRFPDYERVIPKNGNKCITIDRDLLKQALSRSAILCNEKVKGVRFELSTSLLKVSANNPEQESAEEEIAIDYQGEELNIGFNVSYLIDILNTIEPGIVKLTFSDSNTSVLVEEVENNWDSAFVVMPMRL